MSIYGNNFLISIAYKASSPTQASKLAKLMGCNRTQVREVRNAAALLRDEGKDAFDQQFEPYDIVDIDIASCHSMKLKLSIDKTYEKRPINSSEFNEIASFITTKLAKFGIKVQVDHKDPHPYVKSTLKLK